MSISGHSLETVVVCAVWSQWGWYRLSSPEFNLSHKSNTLQITFSFSGGNVKPLSNHYEIEKCKVLNVKLLIFSPHSVFYRTKNTELQ